MASGFPVSLLRESRSPATLGRGHFQPTLPTRVRRLHLARGSAQRLDVITARPPSQRRCPGHAPRRGALMTYLRRALPPLECSSLARGLRFSPTAGTHALSVAFPFRHVPGRLLSADPGVWNPKGPAGRSRAELHAAGDK